MNETNRAVNRVVLFVVGIILLSAGGAAVAATTWGDAGRVWGDLLGAARDWLSDADAATRLPGDSAVSWLAIAAVAVAVAVVVVSVVIVAHLGRTTSTPVLRVTAAEDDLGGVVVRPAFASDVIGHALSGREEIVHSRISTARVKGQDILHVDVIPRKRTSPAAVADLVTRATDALAVMTGRDLPVYISIRTSVRARLAADQPRVR